MGLLQNMQQQPTGDTFSNGQWGAQPQGPGYKDAWQVWQPGQIDPATGKAFFNAPTNERIGTADVNSGFATGAGQAYAPVTGDGHGGASGVTGDWVPQFLKDHVTRGVTLNGQQGFEVDPSEVGNLPGVMVQTGRDNGKYAPKAKGGLLGDLAPILGLAAMFVPGLQPFAAGLNIASGLSSGNIGQAIGGALGLPGVGSAVTGFVGSGLGDLGVADSLIPYASKGLISAGTTALSGGDLGQSLTNGLASGAGSYAGNQVSGLLGDSVPSALGQGISQATAGMLGTAIKGGDIGQGALLSGINGLGSGLGVPNGVTNVGTNYYLQQQQLKRRQQAQAQALAMLRAQNGGG